MDLNVYSEIGKLKAVLLHRPGSELENLVPDTLEELLFDDIPFLQVAQKEHDEFAGLLRSKDVKVYYLTNLVSETLAQSDEALDEFLNTFVDEALQANRGALDFDAMKPKVIEYLKSFDDLHSMVKMTVAGIRAENLSELKPYLKKDCLFICDPIPNLYFQRDPYVTVGNGKSINKMFSSTRNRETLYSSIIFKYHPEFKESGPLWYDRKYDTPIEGGDILILNKKTLAIGISQRTRFDSIKKLASNIFFDQNNSFESILAIDIGENRKYMHLDTVFTQVDIDTYSVHPGIINEALTIYELTKDGNEIKIVESLTKLDELLAKYTNQEKVNFIKCGGDDPITSAREQWNDGANTLAIAPGEVVVYSRNTTTNKLLEKEGIIVHEISSAELSRGRGGPRCMSMPLIREDIE